MLTEFRKDWLDSLKIKGLSEQTLNSYFHDLKYFFEYLEFYKIDYSNMDIADAREYIRYRVEQMNSSSSTSRRMLIQVSALACIRNL